MMMAWSGEWNGNKFEKYIYVLRMNKGKQTLWISEIFLSNFLFYENGLGLGGGERRERFALFLYWDGCDFGDQSSSFFIW